jgi:hypothetical protein
MASAGIASVPEISGAVLRNAEGHHDTFLHAEPFKHVVIEDFFEPSFAERLLADFPVFDSRLATNEFGMTGRKAVNANIREISAVYRRLYEAINSVPFLDLVSHISGISGLVLDPTMYGGGTHDNQHGQELDPHVDFNYDEAQQLHRRLNLIVYLNKEWSGEWGGALEMHSNPRDPAANHVTSYAPVFNRCVMFETNERSWHGFPRIDLPADKRHLSRKSISIYLYTKDRPTEEIAPMHGTFYVQRPLPKHITAGCTLTERDAEYIQWLLFVRDGWISAYQRMELEKNQEIADKALLIKDLKKHTLAPLTGYVLQEGPAVGLRGDGWVASHAELRIRALVPASEIVLRGYRPETFPGGRIHLSIGEARSQECSVSGGLFETSLQPPQFIHGTFVVSIDFEPDTGPATTNAEDRGLAFVIVELGARHPDSATLVDSHNQWSSEQASARERIQDLERQLAAHGDLAGELERKVRELAECVKRLHAAERTIEARTAWAQRNAAEVDDLRGQLHALQRKLWVRLLRKVRLLP